MLAQSMQFASSGLRSSLAALLGILQAAVLVVTGSNVYVMDNLQAVEWLCMGNFMTQPVAFWITPAGQGMAAIGDTERAATLSGLPVNPLKTL
jgi:ribose/xylose/arabinose/galactoside ABC-type transport system permease subunit